MTFRTVRAILFAAAAAFVGFLPGSGLAQAPDPAHVREVRDDVILTADVNGLFESQKVTGTNVNFGAGSGAINEAPGPNPNPEAFVASRAEAYAISINGTRVRTWTRGMVLPPRTPLTGGSSVTFASTNFADGATITLKMVASWSLQKQKDVGTETYAGSATLTAVRRVVAYNRGLTLKTDEYYDEPTGTYRLGPSPRPNDFDTVSAAAALQAETIFPAMNHTVLGGTNGNSEHLKPDLLPLLGRFTAFFGFTEGEPANFRAPRDAALSFAGGLGSEVAVATASRASLPLPNLAVMHACSTLANRGRFGYDVANALYLTDAGATIPGKAYAGYKERVFSLVAPPTGTLEPSVPLSEYANQIYAGLRNGNTLNVSLRIANDQYRPLTKVGTTWMQISIIAVGDVYSRLVNVYTGGDDNAPDLWYSVTGY